MVANDDPPCQSEDMKTCWSDDMLEIGLFISYWPGLIFAKWCIDQCSNINIPKTITHSKKYLFIHGAYLWCVRIRHLRSIP